MDALTELAGDALPFLFIIALLWLYGEFKIPGKGGEEETRLIQEIHEGLSRMDTRVAALETILMEHAQQQSDANAASATAAKEG